MEQSSTLPLEIIGVLSRGGTVVTGNQRAERTLRLAFDRQRRASGMSSWHPPEIYAWDNWTSQLWKKALLSGAADELLLNRTQELQLWRSIISADQQRTGLQNFDSLANMAAKAWQLLSAYRGQTQLRNLGVSEDTRTFQRWAQTFKQHCKSNGYLSLSELEDGLEKISIAAPTEILLVGFDSKTPAQIALLKSLDGKSVRIDDLPLLPMAKHRYLASSQDLDHELTIAARWLRDTLESNPGARLGVIHPDVNSERAEIDRTFRRILAPELQSIAAGAADGPFEFSLGQPLAQMPMIAVGLKLLRWVIAPLSIDKIGSLLLSPYFIIETERQGCAEFDALEVRRAKLLRPELGLSDLIAQVERHPSSKCPARLLSQLHSLNRTAAKLLTDLTKQRSYAEWADTIRELLQSSGWASGRRDDTIEFQTGRKWEAALDELSTLDFEGVRRNFAETLAQLETIAQQTLFAPESRESPIQIMSPQEAAGSRFDGLYFLRCSDLNWPTVPGSNPMLGWRLQHALGMPGSDTSRDLAHARATTARLASSAATIVFSYASETADGHQRPSPLLAEMALKSIAAIPVLEAHCPVELEEIADPGFIPLANLKVRGGANILKLQAACGFRAFAETRLHSDGLNTLAAGMDAAERGSSVHATMAHLWEYLKTQAALRSLSPTERADNLDRAITYALEGVTRNADSPWDAAYIEVQHERLRRLILPWLDRELDRPSFEVMATEKRFDDLSLGPLTLDIRVDRIDTLLDEHGLSSGQILLDYKTGDARSTHWLGPRPDDPQLPLYTVLSASDNLAALSFILVRPGKDLAMRGFAREEGILPKPFKPNLPSLEEQVADWQRTLISLAEDFAAGDARVRPKEHPTTCQYCKQRVLCRLDPAMLEDDPGDEGDGEEETANG